MRLRTGIGLAATLALATAMPALAAGTAEKVAPFSALSLSGPFDLAWHRAARQSVVLTGDPYVVENLRVAVRDGVLRITWPTGLDLPKHATVHLAIGSPDLSRLDTHGALRARLTGLAGPTFTFHNDGAAAATLTGDVGTFAIASHGAASIDAGALHARDLSLRMRGQGNFRLYATDDAAITMYGAGHAELLGHPKHHQFKTLAYAVISMP